MSDVLVKPWKRYGHDRVYLERVDGRRLGYWDNKTQTASLDDDSDAELFYRTLREQLHIDPPAVGADCAVANAHAASAGSAPAAVRGDIDQPPPPTIEADIYSNPSDARSLPTWRDLSETRSGNRVA